MWTRPSFEQIHKAIEMITYSLPEIEARTGVIEFTIKIFHLHLLQK